MSLARKIILHSPITNESALAPFVEQCLVDGVALIAVIGAGSSDLEAQIDFLIVGDGSDPDRFICTTAHPDEPFDDVVNFVEHWGLIRRDPYQVMRL